MFIFWLPLLWLISEVFGNTKLEARLEKVEGIKGDERTLIDLNLKIVGRERILNGTLKTLAVFDESYRVHGNLYIFKNDNWVQSNLRVDMNGCDFVQSFLSRIYKSALQYFPNPICPLPVGEYFIINAKASSENWPFYLSPGLKKIELNFEKDGKMVGGMRGQFIVIETHV